MRFWLGVHKAHWLERTDVPLMVSHTTLRERSSRRPLPRACGPWVLDSGAFSEIAALGHFRTRPGEYVAAVRRYTEEIGNLTWTAPQDWMCEPIIISGGIAGRQKFAGTHLSVPEHQRRTIASVLELRSRAPELPWLPVLQGYELDDYRRHIDDYARAGIDLHAEPLVGLGSVCRRQATSEINRLVTTLVRQGLRLHGFGVKTSGLVQYGWALRSADSLAWSDDARRLGRPLPGCVHPRGGKTCANCLRYALWWRQRVLARGTGSEQLTLEVAA